MADVEQQYVPLHLHTEYSLLDGAIRIKELLEFCKENNFPELAYQTTLNEINTSSCNLPFSLSVAKRDEVDEMITL